MSKAIKLVSPNFSDLLTPNIEIGKFPDGDSHVRIPQLAECRGKEVIVFHRLYPKQNTALVALLLILDSLKQEKAKVTVAAPYLPYARQDKKKLDGEVASAHTVCNLIARAGCKKFVTFDCHFLNQEGLTTFGELSIENISMGHDLIEYAKTIFGDGPFEIIGPDAGANYLVEKRGGKAMKKVRKEYEDGRIDYRHIETLDGEFEVKGKNVLLLDDMISTGNTMIRALEKLAEAGAKRICCAAIHGLFLYNCLDKIRKFSDCIFATDTIENSQAAVSIKDKLLALGA